MIPRVMLDAYVAIQERPMDRVALAAVVYCHVQTAARVLSDMHKAGQVHVVEWQRRRGKHLPVYAFGAGEDAPKLVPLTDKERRARVKVSVEERDFASARRRQLRRKIKVDPLTAAFFGVR